MELTERATSAEKDSLRDKIAAVEAEKHALEAQSKGVADRLTNLQASYDGLVQKLAEANAALEAFAPLISKDAFAQAQAMLSGGNVLGAERKFVEIAEKRRSIRCMRLCVTRKHHRQRGLRARTSGLKSIASPPNTNVWSKATTPTSPAPPKRRTAFYRQSDSQPPLRQPIFAAAEAHDRAFPSPASRPRGELRRTFYGHRICQ